MRNRPVGCASSGELPESVHYLGVDLSPVMINLAANRLSPWVERAEVVLVDGSLPLPANDGFADCVLSTFVFDLLDADYARAVLDDLRRILTPVAGSAWLASRMVTGGWKGPYLKRGTGCGTLRRNWLEGVAPSLLGPLLGSAWQIQHHSQVHQWGLVTDVVIAVPSDRPDEG